MKNDIDSILNTLFSGGKLNVGSGTKSRAAKDAEDFLNSIEKNECQHAEQPESADQRPR
ncbi:MAG: hypothetical protein ACLR0S_10135 [Hominenteromicrobium sp.]|uniref:hypothetical protein n=1 Tax=Hominenteromicrobium sp. TaxID=3073581 RepID=UPI0039A1DBCF